MRLIIYRLSILLFYITKAIIEGFIIDLMILLLTINITNLLKDIITI